MILSRKRMLIPVLGPCSIVATRKLLTNEEAKAWVDKRWGIPVRPIIVPCVVEND